MPPRHEAVSAGPPSVVQLARELHERHKREDAVIRKVLRRARAAHRRAWRPAAVREGGARMVAASGRDGTGERDDGSGGDSDGDGGGSSEPSGPRSHAPFLGGVR